VASSLYPSTAGRRTLLYLLIPRNRRHFTPALITTIAETDETRTSKKDAEVRAAEIRAAASPDLLAWLAKEGAAVSRETGGSLLVGDIMLEADGGASLSIELLACKDSDVS
jgi:pumilio homology domain family member 6